MLSEIARIYDPLGFLSPLTLFAKRLLQHLWTLGLNWDDSPPDDVIKVWTQYKSEISCLSSLRISRVLFDSSFQSCQLHAFCDASESGYACVIYFRVIDNQNQVSIRFVMAKAKVAPLKRLSIPRLELCAAVLLSKLVDYVASTYKSSFPISQIVAWTDSTVALTWIRSSPHRWKTFVANRISFIHERITPSCWRYVPSADNPADPASRGLLPREVLSCSLWWAAPTFLQLSPDLWPEDRSRTESFGDVNVEEKVVALVVQSTFFDTFDLLNKFSSLRKIQGVLAHVFRFVGNVRSLNKTVGPISAQE